MLDVPKSLAPDNKVVGGRSCFSSGCTRFEGDAHLASSCRFLSSSSVTFRLRGAFHHPLVPPDQLKGCISGLQNILSLCWGTYSKSLWCARSVTGSGLCGMEYVLERRAVLCVTRDSPVGTCVGRPRPALHSWPQAAGVRQGSCPDWACGLRIGLCFEARWCCLGNHTKSFPPEVLLCLRPAQARVYTVSTHCRLGLATCTLRCPQLVCSEI